ncbi:MAG: replicative DNA helicase [Pseudomonadota bacterium]|nr:replicative DNA helicase [Pseudomonadota bacterium]
MSDIDHHTPLLHSNEAEQSVLGALMRFPESFDQISDLQAKHFCGAEHREIFGVIMKLAREGKPHDLISVLTGVQAAGGPFVEGMAAYLNDMAQSVPYGGQVARHAGIVVEHALLRATLHVGSSIVDLVQDRKGKSADEILDKAQSMVNALAERRVRNEPRMIRDVLADFIDSVALRAGGLETAIATGIESIDRLLNGGMRPGQLVIVAGRPSMGKTALTTDIGLNMSLAVSVLNFSMEMESQEIAARALANRGRVSLAHLMGKINENDTDTWNRVTHGSIALDTLRFAIDDTAAISLLELRLKAKAWKRKHGLDVIIVDYLGLMTGGGGDKRHEQIGSYSRGLKAMAKELGVVVIALAQLNRKVEDRPDRRPMLSDLRDSGEIEQDADIVMLVHRQEMYEPENYELKGFAEVLVRKHRSGSLGDIPLNFDGPTCRFSEWSGATPSAPTTGRKKQWDG